MRWFPIRIRINLKRALFSIRNRWIPSPAENNDRAQISSGCWNDGCTKGSESGCVQGFDARLTKKIGKCVLKCVLEKENTVDSLESTVFSWWTVQDLNVSTLILRAIIRTSSRIIALFSCGFSPKLERKTRLKKAKCGQKCGQITGWHQGSV